MTHKIQHKLIEAIYNITINPDKYYELLALWESEFVENSETPLVADFTESHCNRAFDILEMIGSVNRASNLKQSIENHPFPTFIISETNQIIYSNNLAKNLYNLDVGIGLSELSFGYDQEKKIASYQSRINYAEEEVFFGSSNNESSPTLYALSRAFDYETSKNFLQISIVNAIWNKSVGKKIGNIFGLSTTELDLARRLTLGENLADIAKHKKRSVETIRSQIKSIFRKTATKTQGETVKLFVALLNFEMQKNYDANRSLSIAPHFNNLLKQNNFVIRDGGRHLYYEIHGDPDGEPVLFLHGLISGTRFPKAAIDYFCKHKIKIIAPHRAGFGYSDVNLEKDKLSCFTKDILAILSAENIVKYKILAHHAGAFYAYYLAQKIPQNIVKIRIINGDIPIISIKQIKAMSGNQKVLVYTAKYTPKLLPFLIRASNAHFEKVGLENALNIIFKEAEYEHSVLKISELKGIIINGFIASYHKGVESLVSDIQFLCGRNWNDLVDKCDCPVEIFHSMNNDVTPIRLVRKFIAEHKQLELTALEGGQFNFYKNPEKSLINL